MKREYDFSRGRRGPVIRVPKGKTRITIRLDKDLIDWFRSQVEAAGGGNYQTLINSALRSYVREMAASEIAEEREVYARQATAKREPEHGTSITLERKLLLRSDDLARSLRVSREELIERGLKAVLAAEGRL